MRGINKVVLLGSAGAAPTIQAAPDGRTTAKLWVATTRSVRDGDTWSEVTEWHTVQLEGELAEVAAKYVGKGSKIAIEGELRTDSWTDARGVTRRCAYIHCTTLHLIPRGKE